VDGRHKAGHDTEQMGTPARYFNLNPAVGPSHGQVAGEIFNP
jgi:hypothetical protein